ncbi:MAG: phosphate acyltransferase PlsX [Planctomycetota bacterium]
MRIAVDAMGGDNAPRVVVEGAVRAANEVCADIILAGDRGQIEELLREFPDKTGRVTIEHANSAVLMADSPVEALRRKDDTSIGRCAELAKAGEADAIVSAGNTGAAIAAATLAMGMLEGIRKPGIIAPLPTIDGGECVIIDLGANIKPKPEHLLDYGLMAREYCAAILGKPDPAIGLLNIGAEDAKGDVLVRETHALFRASDLNFAGNVEGRDIFQGRIDAVVCGGFVGNVVLKVAEGTAEAVFGTMQAALTKKLTYRIGARLCRAAFKKARRELDSSAYGGALLLGIDGICIISHGSADAEAISNAIRVATELSKQHVNNHIVEAVKKVKNTVGARTATA